MFFRHGFIQNGLRVQHAFGFRLSILCRNNTSMPTRMANSSRLQSPTRVPNEHENLICAAAAASLISLNFLAQGWGRFSCHFHIYQIQAFHVVLYGTVVCFVFLACCAALYYFVPRITWLLIEFVCWFCLSVWDPQLSHMLVIISGGKCAIFTWIWHFVFIKLCSLEYNYYCFKRKK